MGQNGFLSSFSLVQGDTIRFLLFLETATQTTGVPKRRQVPAGTPTSWGIRAAILPLTLCNINIIRLVNLEVWAARVGD